MATAKKKIETVEEYIGSFPKEVQQNLKKISQTIRKAAPGAEEVISYSIPAFKLNGWVAYYSVYTNHYSLTFPPPFTVFEVFKKELAPYEQSKTTIQFPKDEPVPFDLITKLVAFRVKENAEKAKKNTSKK